MRLYTVSTLSRGSTVSALTAAHHVRSRSLLPRESVGREDGGWRVGVYKSALYVCSLHLLTYHQSHPSTMSNTAAYQNTFMSRPFSIEPAPMPLPKPHQIIIQTRAIGINPFDAAVQNLGLVYDAAAHPVVLGVDVAGIVQSVGEKVTRFHPGDSVCACTIGMTSGTSEHQQQHDSFQLYCASRAAFAARIPDNVSFSEAAVFLSCMKTAAYALFVKDTLALDLPPITSRAAPNGKVLIVWGGSSIVGSCAIQMASLAGYTVIATPSEHNFEHCRALGADSVFDYKSPSVIEDIVTACKATGKEPVGAFVAYFNNDSTVTCSHIVSQLGGSKIVGTVVPPYTPVPEAAAGSVKVTSSELISIPLVSVR